MYWFGDEEVIFALLAGIFFLVGLVSFWFGARAGYGEGYNDGMVDHMFEKLAE